MLKSLQSGKLLNPSNKEKNPDLLRSDVNAVSRVKGREEAGLQNTIEEITEMTIAAITKATNAKITNDVTVTDDYN